MCDSPFTSFRAARVAPNFHVAAEGFGGHLRVAAAEREVDATPLLAVAARLNGYRERRVELPTERLDAESRTDIGGNVQRHVARVRVEFVLAARFYRPSILHIAAH